MKENIFRFDLMKDERLKIEKIRKEFFFQAFRISHKNNF